MRIAAMMLLLGLLVGCKSQTTGLVAIASDDACASCRMLISDRRYAAELLDADGTVYKFDDIACMLHFAQAHSKNSPAVRFYVSDFSHRGQWLDATRAYFVELQSNASSPMASGLAAFHSTSDAMQVVGPRSGLLRWNDLLDHALTDANATAGRIGPEEAKEAGHGR